MYITMVVPYDDKVGPVRKRARLSLKSNKKSVSSPVEKYPSSSTKDQNIVEVACGSAPEDDNKQCEASTEVESSVPSEEILVPPVASLENLGNTCFLNSVLQVLRYTPRFMTGLTDLFKNILITEKAAADKAKEECFEEVEETQKHGTVSWELVKFLYKMYKDMQKNEERYPEMATADVTSMAVKPNKVLDIIRELNPMFEGNYQHDAQELLRCMLCYLGDAELELNKQFSELHTYIVKPPPKVNTIMKQFLSSGKKTMLKSKTESNQKDTIMKIKVEEKVKKECVKMDDKIEEGVADGHQKKNINCEAEEINQKCRSKRSLSKTGQKKTILHKPYKPVIPQENKGQTNVYSIFNTVKPATRRLGMQRVQIHTNSSPTSTSSASRDSNNNDDYSHDHNNNENSFTSRNKQCIKSLSNKVTSKDNKLSPVNGIDNKKLEVKIEKCDRVCDSPLKSVNASEAMKSLNSKMQSGNIPGKAKRKISCFDDDIKEESSVQNLIEQTNVLIPSSPFKQPKESPGKKTLQLTPSKTLLTTHSPNRVPNSLSFSPRRQSPRLLKKADATSTSAQISPLNAVRKVDFDSPQDIKPCKSNGNQDCSISSPKEQYHKEQGLCDKFNFVEKLFQGTMMLRTKCMECEFARERKEDFQDVSVPLRGEKGDIQSDDEEHLNKEIADESCLSKLMSAFLEVERLRDENKYFCENCSRYVEAERSLHYEFLPDILTLHLKRFSASDRLFGSLSKINDHITLPLNLPCLQYQCPRSCKKKSHMYSLYGIVTHAGTTLSSGHYLSYVKVKSTDQSKIQACSDGPNAHLVDGCSKPNVEWYECDDESIRIFSQEDFSEKLLGKESSLMGTPYVLFYHRQSMAT